MRGEKARARVSWWPTAAAVGVYLGLAVVCYWGAWSTDPARNSLAGGDQFQNTWYLAWTPFALLHGHNPFLSSYLNYPYGLNTLTNTGIILLGVLASPVTLLFGATAAFNTMLTLALATSATSGYVLARRLTGWRPAAFVGGLVYGFSPYEIAEGTGHLHLSFAPLPPLILLALYEIAVARTAHRVRWAVVLGLLVTAQFFVSSEILVDTAIVCAIALVILAVVGRRDLRSHLARVLPPFALAGSIAAVLLAYPVWFALKGPARISGPVQLAPQGYRADLLAPLVPDSLQRIAPHGLAAMADHFSSNISENGSYLGITLLLTMAVGVVVLWRLPVVRMLATLGAAAFVISLGAAPVLKVAPPGIVTGFPLPERLFTKIRLLSNIIPGRFSLFVALFAALLLAVLLDELHRPRLAATARCALPRHHGVRWRARGHLGGAARGGRGGARTARARRPLRRGGDGGDGALLLHRRRPDDPAGHPGAPLPLRRRIGGRRSRRLAGVDLPALQDVRERRAGGRAVGTDRLLPRSRIRPGHRDQLAHGRPGPGPSPGTDGGPARRRSRPDAELGHPHRGGHPRRRGRPGHRHPLPRLALRPSRPGPSGHPGVVPRLTRRRRRWRRGFSPAAGASGVVRP